MRCLKVNLIEIVVYRVNIGKGKYINEADMRMEENRQRYAMPKQNFSRFNWCVIIQYIVSCNRLCWFRHI